MKHFTQSKQLQRAEAHKVGRVECHYEIGKAGEFKVEHRAADSKTKPRMVRASEIPVGKPRGVEKPTTRG